MEYSNNQIFLHLKIKILKHFGGDKKTIGIPNKICGDTYEAFGLSIFWFTNNKKKI